MADPKPEVKHSGYIEGDPYCAKCCCDWEGPTRLTMDEAEADLTKHYAEVK